MIFDIDKQTINDLELFQDSGNAQSGYSVHNRTETVYSVYNRTATVGGQEMLYKLFKSPVSDPEMLQRRKEEMYIFSNQASGRIPCSILALVLPIESAVNLR